MKFKKLRWLTLFLVLLGLATLLYTINPPQEVQAQQPTGSIPTVTGTPIGPVAVAITGLMVNINVRDYPATLANQVGVILPGQVVNVKGKTIAGDWLLIDYPGAPGGQGWIWSQTVTVTGGEVPVVEPPATPTPKVTVTINPTLAAQFVKTPRSTSLPTFTPPPALNIPIYSTGAASSGNIPIGLVIILLLGAGVIVALISFVQSR